MCISQNAITDGASNVSTDQTTAERPFKIDYWQDLSMCTDGMPTIDGAFMDEAIFNGLTLPVAIKTCSLEQLRQIQDRIRAWFLCGLEEQLSESTPSYFEDRLYALHDMQTLLEMAIVGHAHGSKSFYYLTTAQFQSMPSDRVLFIKEFYAMGFARFCLDYSYGESLRETHKATISSLDRADIKSHTKAYWMVDEFISFVLKAMQQHEVNSLSTASTPA